MASRTSTEDLQDLRVIQLAYIPRGAPPAGGETEAQAAATVVFDAAPTGYTDDMVGRLSALFPRKPNSLVNRSAFVFFKPLFQLRRAISGPDF